ncbi:CYTH domain-containing protein [Ferruginibacter sp.]
MGLEIERKYLVDHQTWNAADKSAGKLYRQGYISTDENKTIRIRLAGTDAWLTIKGKTTGATRSEFEYSIPAEDAIQMLNTLAESELSKTRYKIPCKGKLWEVDVFHDENEGLIVAEIELASEDEEFELPEWASTEVTGDAKYYNSNLTLYPFKRWR